MMNSTGYCLSVSEACTNPAVLPFLVDSGGLTPEEQGQLLLQLEQIASAR